MKAHLTMKTFAASLLAATAVCYANNDDAGPAAWLGVATAPLDEVAAAQLDLPEGVGVAVKLVVPESPAAEAGIARNDVLFDLDGSEVTSPEQLSELVRAKKTGDEISVGVLQRGKRNELVVTLGSRPADLPSPAGEPARGFGVDLGDLGHFEMKGFPFGGDPEDIEKHMEDMRQQMQKHFQGMLDLEGLADLQGEFNIIDSSAKSVSMRHADGSSIEIHTSDGETKVVAKDADGTVLFDGPATTAAQREKMPERVREMYEDAQQSGSGLNFEGFRLNLPKLGVPELKPGKRLGADEGEEEAPIPPAEREGKKVEL